MSANLDSETTNGMIKLSEAARILGCHVETLRLRVHSGELTARRGAHGAYFISQSQLADMRSPLRRASRTFDPGDLEWTWGLVAEAGWGYDPDQISALIDLVRQDPKADRAIYNLLSVGRLRRAGLSTGEIAFEVGISTRHVRRLACSDFDDDLERLAKRHEAGQKAKKLREARAVINEIENLVHRAGLNEHAMRARRNEPIRETGRPRPAIRIRELDRAMRVNLRGARLTREQLDAIALAGMSIDVLNELLLNGLPTGYSNESNKASSSGVGR